MKPKPKPKPQMLSDVTYTDPTGKQRKRYMVRRACIYDRHGRSLGFHEGYTPFDKMRGRFLRSFAISPGYINLAAMTKEDANDWLQRTTEEKYKMLEIEAALNRSAA
jgi:hypothetical protein